MHLERQTEFGDITWAQKGPAGVLLDPVESVSHGVGMNDKPLCRDVHGGVVVLPHPKRVEEDLAVLVSQIAERFSTSPTDLTMISGALTAAVARTEPSKTATRDAGSPRPRSVTLAQCRACGVSRRSSKRALTPTRLAAMRHTSATISSNLWSDLICAMPICTSGSSRHAECTSRLASLHSMSGRASVPTAGSSAAITTNGP